MMRISPTRLAVACLLIFVSSASAGNAAATSIAKAYLFLDKRMDKYASGQTLRLLPSYVPTPAFPAGDKSYTYDDAVVVMALLERGSADDMARARLLGDSFVYAQTHDPIHDGRVRNAYDARHFIRHDGAPSIADDGSYTGNLAWTGMALAQLYHATGEASYLAAAEGVSNVIQVNMYDTRGAGGYTGGFDQSLNPILWKSTEHNIDCYGLFTMLAQLTGETAWSDDAQHALTFIDAMWNAGGGYFYIGTGNDGVTINTGDPTPEDVQTWSYLSTGEAQHQGSIDWALANLSATSGGFQGLSFEVRDRSGVWFEGTAHAAAALLARDSVGDKRTAKQLISDIEVGQQSAPNADGRGIDAASKDGLQTDDSGDAYFAALHTGATAWFCLAAQRANPFRLLIGKP